MALFLWSAYSSVQLLCTMLFKQARLSCAMGKSSTSLKRHTSSVGKPRCQVFYCAKNHIFCIKHELFKFLSTNLCLNLGIVRLGVAMGTARNLASVAVS